jgi:CheY-like chemotaxis protein
MALELLSSRPAYDVVVCDLMMPGMDGPALHDAIKDAHPGLERRMIFCSGGAFTPRAQKFLEESRLVLLEKPLSASALRDAIREVLFATPGKAVAQ